MLISKKVSVRKTRKNARRAAKKRGRATAGSELRELPQRHFGERETPQFGMLKGRIETLDPGWAEPQNDVEAWLRGDV